jgi:hypothetical protein
MNHPVTPAPDAGRRQFLSRSLPAALVAPFFIARSAWAAAPPPSDRIGIGLIGLGNIARGHRDYWLNHPGAVLTAVCDVNQAARERTLAQIREHGHACAAHHEFAELIARADVDAVVICTPDQWHAPIALAAMRAGKDVFVEKPMTLTIHEGQVLVAAARRYGTILQVGSQQRSDTAFRKAAEIVRNGWIGEVRQVYVRLGSFPPPADFPAEPVPDGFDYDRWLGPAPFEPYHPERVSGSYGGGWRRFWEYGSRKNGDWGAHHYDIVQWALGRDAGGPVWFVPKGYAGEPYQYYAYADGIRVIRDHPDDRGHMIRFIGTAGEVRVSRNGRLDTEPAGLAGRVLTSADIHLRHSADHRADWYAGMRTRHPPICPAEVGHRTATIGHLAGIAERLHRPLRWDPVAETIIGDPVARRMQDRPRRAPYHLFA